jgi:hypothetical protein
LVEAKEFVDLGQGQFSTTNVTSEEAYYPSPSHTPVDLRNPLARDASADDRFGRSKLVCQGQVRNPSRIYREKAYDDGKSSGQKQ